MPKGKNKPVKISHRPAFTGCHKAITRVGSGVAKAKVTAKISGKLSFAPITKAPRAKMPQPQSPPNTPRANTTTLMVLLSASLSTSQVYYLASSNSRAPRCLPFTHQLSTSMIPAIELPILAAPSVCSPNAGASPNVNRIAGSPRPASRNAWWTRLNTFLLAANVERTATRMLL
jgi:hypothetical protein